MTCRNCTHATTKNPNGGVSVHRNAMAALGFTGCAHDKTEATTYSTEYVCGKWAQASEEEMRKRTK